MSSVIDAFVELFETKFNEAPKMRTRSNQKAFDVMTSVWRSIPALKQSLDVGFHHLKDIAALRLSHEDRLDEIAAEVERYEDIVRKDEIRMAEALTAAQPLRN
eukprot:jgi/Tetstr1/423589/TSEL_014261.t1